MEAFRGGKSQKILTQFVKQILNLSDDDILSNFPHDALGPGMHLDLYISNKKKKEEEKERRKETKWTERKEENEKGWLKMKNI